jgi:hypothetical protein
MFGVVKVIEAEGQDEARVVIRTLTRPEAASA